MDYSSKGSSQNCSTCSYPASDCGPRAFDTPDMTSPTPVVPRTGRWDRKLMGGGRRLQTDRKWTLMGAASRSSWELGPRGA